MRISDWSSDVCSSDLRIDYDRELALVATVQVPNPEHRGHPREQIIGFAHYLRNPDGRGAEYALVIGDAWQRRGLGAQLMGGLIDAAQEQGLTYIDGLVLATNRPMLSLMTHLGLKNEGAEIGRASCRERVCQ